ncbi:MAG: hypothetical protein A3G59_00125 [Candidatus Taylorbacteria bacterium RIFCSPLOWO2_12_FULL_47_20]|uniref:Uncharacterized protein n=1 Tax=Candidatus Taylorbacteria bacterium RIFCSPLOWO2_12_FULL_47_20 TaxID=1802335 RepID=A0A1G2P990_9BACT|nr:MAG: hypothetical protein A3G59_00125 [Candidatus Taylorbacteria bacterium RIFCSPLOWO2_12_FULL_47_20]
MECLCLWRTDRGLLFCRGAFFWDETLDVAECDAADGVCALAPSDAVVILAANTLLTPLTDLVLFLLKYELIIYVLISNYTNSSEVLIAKRATQNS